MITYIVYYANGCKQEVNSFGKVVEAIVYHNAIGYERKK